MNVYSCWHRGNFGYGCRLRGRRWLFVPELGQPSGDIRRNIALRDLVFSNPLAQTMELGRERELSRPWLSRWLRSLRHPGYRPATIGGMLFSPG